MVTEDHLKEGRVYPPLNDVREVSTKLAARLIEYAYKEGIATTYPEPYEKEAHVRKNQYHNKYEGFVPITYPWPGMDYWSTWDGLLIHLGWTTDPPGTKHWPFVYLLSAEHLLVTCFCSIDKDEPKKPDHVVLQGVFLCLCIVFVVVSLNCRLAIIWDEFIE